jgi:hypothetical protein
VQVQLIAAGTGMVLPVLWHKSFALSLPAITAA